MNSNETIKVCTLIGLMLAFTLTYGCASGPTQVEEDYGNSVRDWRAQQTLNPTPVADTTPVEQTDGQRMDNALNSYRKSVGDPENVREDIIFNIGDD